MLSDRVGRARAAGIGLLVAIGVVAGIVALTGSSPRQFHGIFGDADGVKEPAAVYVDGWLSGNFNPLTSATWSWATALSSLVWVAAVWVIGSCVLGALPGIGRWPLLTRIVAGFLPGYVIVLLPLQLIYAALPPGPASWLALAVVIGIAAALLGVRAPEFVDPGDVARRRSVWIGLAVTIAGFGLALVHRLQAGRNFMVPDSITVFLQALASPTEGLSAAGRLAQWDQQSDEWLFTAPINFGPGAGSAALLPFYFTQVASLVSFSALVFGLIWMLSRRRRGLTAGIATGAVLFMTPQVLPWYYLSLFGGQNPAAWLGHPGRLVGIVAPWVALVVVAQWSPGASRTMAVLLFAGLGFLTINAAVYVLVALVLFLLWCALRDLRCTWVSSRAGKSTVVAAAGLALVAPLLAYGLIGTVTNPNQLAIPLLFGVLFASAGFALMAASGPLPKSAAPLWGPLRALALACAGVATGLVLAGNLTAGMFGGRLRTALGALLPGYEAPVASRGLLANDPGGFPTFPYFYGTECSISAHCLGMGGYLMAYGMLMALAGATWLGLGRPRPGSADISMRGVWFALVGFLAVAFLVVDFTGGTNATPWVLTRFIEVPYYGIIGLATVVLIGSRSRLTAIITSAVLVGWTVIPLVANLVFVQWLVNARFLLEGIGG